MDPGSVVFALALLGGIIALATAFLAGRFLHLWSERYSHRLDLASQVVKPWLLETRRLGTYLSGPGLANYIKPSADGHGYGHRRAYHGITVDFPPNQPMWERAREHWPASVDRWNAAGRSLEQLDKVVEGVVKDLEAALPNPNRGIEWEHERPSYPGFGRRLAAIGLWQKYWNLEIQSQAAFEKEVRASKWWRPDSGDRDALVAAASGVLFSEEGQRRLRDIAALAEKLRKELESFETVLLELNYDRNLRGTCTYCPQFRANPAAS